MPAPPHIAVMLFTRSSTQEAQAKHFCNGHARRKAIAAQLISHTKKVVQQSGLPLFVVDSASQQGHTFGERLEHAFAQAFAAGYEQVICLGNDTPGLTPALLRSAASQLQQEDFVFGRAADGGVYLMGLSRQSMVQLDFRQISWNTSHVFAQLCAQTAPATVSILAPILSDTDDRAGILRISSSSNLGKLTHVLWSLLQVAPTKINYSFSPIPSAVVATKSLRAPPVL
ncbi:DUF2064 domain-containing protein [uncultured Pontibacter sp.]|uniref:TIGR04282 family arsenosugar biosynthesis glycosyltransferase n=1 Tax=uncultured Pontibacter sp. TaxID=453356 RepID=UPI002611BDF8|nr:DUF2064 domain-containing protein [uncultured Pontibacter sp.]